MTTTTRPRPRQPWLVTAGLGAGALLGLALLRWLPALRRRSKIALIRERAAALTERIGDLAGEAAGRTEGAWDRLKDRVA
ncbi:MAG TPA: hypothetical protein VGE07_00040 [Herpetosiphonaceae bacterium]